jgi:hypothetical protein
MRRKNAERPTANPTATYEGHGVIPPRRANGTENR